MVPRHDPYDRRVTIAIDVGNTAVKVARVTDGCVAPVTRLPTASGPDADALDRLLGAADDPLALVSVVPAWTEAIAEAATRAGLAMLLATHVTIPLPVRLPSPSTVGADRLLGAWTARALVGAPVVVVDVGTATTIDVVDADGWFAGGAILPGPATSMRALRGDTALLPSVPIALPERVIGRDTAEAMRSGVVVGHLAAMEGLLARMTAELGGARPKLVLTGGGSVTLEGLSDVDLLDPDLLLRGLGMLATAAAPVS